MAVDNPKIKNKFYVNIQKFLSIQCIQILNLNISIYVKNIIIHCIKFWSQLLDYKKGN